MPSHIYLITKVEINAKDVLILSTKDKIYFLEGEEVKLAFLVESKTIREKERCMSGKKKMVRILPPFYTFRSNKPYT